jgi:hypothetical protein
MYQPNIHQALLTMPDIPEASTVALLKVVAAHHATLTPGSIMLDSETLPFPIPALATFLTGFVASPTTPATLRIALQQQLTADKAMPVLEVLDGWLGWWAARGGGGGSLAAESKDVKSKRLPTNPFLVLSQAVEDSPPRVEDVSQVSPLHRASTDTCESQDRPPRPSDPRLALCLPPPPPPIPLPPPPTLSAGLHPCRPLLRPLLPPRCARNLRSSKGRPNVSLRRRQASRQEGRR